MMDMVGISLENFSGGPFGPQGDTLCALLIFPGVYSPENLEALEKSAHRLQNERLLSPCRQEKTTSWIHPWKNTSRSYKTCDVEPQGCQAQFLNPFCCCFFFSWMNL